MIALNDSRESQRFEVGTLVQHRRYGYRGVVVAVDDWSASVKLIHVL